MNIERIGQVAQLTELGRIDRHPLPDPDDIDLRIWYGGQLNVFRAEVYRRMGGVWAAYRLTTEYYEVAATDSQAVADGLLKPEALAEMGARCTVFARRHMGRGVHAGHSVKTVYQLVCPRVEKVEGISQEAMERAWVELMDVGIDRLPPRNRASGIDGGGFRLEFRNVEGYRFSRVWSLSPYTEESLGEFYGVYMVLKELSQLD